jgi:hypothetical protein
MATINVSVSEDIYISPSEWFDESDQDDIKEMEQLILEERLGKMSVQQLDLYNKFMELMDRYYTLPQSTIDTIMKL